MPILIGRMLRCLLLTVVVLAGVPVTMAAERAVVRVGILQFGTVSWELEVMQRHGLAER